MRGKGIVFEDIQKFKINIRNCVMSGPKTLNIISYVIHMQCCYNIKVYVGTVHGERYKYKSRFPHYSDKLLHAYNCPLNCKETLGGLLSFIPTYIFKLDDIISHACVVIRLSHM